MASVSLRERVAALEAEVARIKERLDHPARNSVRPKKDWLETVSGSFANDPIYEEAMRLGREWRESFRPKPKRRKKRAK